ncbi:hypothetical protein [Spirulina subsalsa]|uniref:hypothetical protein n=1 Tax=Spirulina subsalsa TaxID=54311 RepID=UPI0002F17860|nr:hypothetical protein [Spirulina subsalsa]
MAESKKKGDDVVQGVSIGLLLWLFFLLALVALGYQVTVSIILGGLGGFSGGWIVAWWNSDEPPSELDRPKTMEEQAGERRTAPGIAEAQARRKCRERRTPRGRVLPIPRFLLTKRKRRR